MLESDANLDAQRRRILQLAAGDRDVLELLVELLVVKVHVQKRLLRKVQIERSVGGGSR